MKIVFLILTLSMNLLQSTYDYKTEKHSFNKSMITTNVINKLITKRINANERFQGRYLGKIRIGPNKIYYVTANSYVYNLKNSPTAENHIFIYDIKMNFIGYYYLSLMDELPIKIINSKLYFKRSGCKEASIINFSEGIPESINIRCNNEDNYYDFQKNNH